MFASSRCPTMVVGFTLLFIWDEKTRALFPARAQFQLRTKPIPEIFDDSTTSCG